MALFGLKLVDFKERQVHRELRVLKALKAFKVDKAYKVYKAFKALDLTGKARGMELTMAITL
jgi:hypothetical protein